MVSSEDRELFDIVDTGVHRGERGKMDRLAKCIFQ